MKRFFQGLFLTLVLLSFAFSSAFAFDFRRVKLNPIPSLNASEGNSGYNEFRIYAKNNSGKSVTVKLQLEDRYKSSMGTVSRTYQLAPGSLKMLSLNFFKTSLNSKGVKVEIDGYECPKSFLGNINYYNNRQKEIVLTDSSISKSEFKDKIFKALDLTSYYSEQESFDGSLNQYPDDWRTYSQFDYIVFYTKTLEGIEPSSREAMFNYVRMGGSLAIIGDFELPDDFKIQTTNVDQKLFTAKFGKCLVLPKNFLSHPKSTYSGMDFSKLGFRSEKAPRYCLTFRNSTINKFSGSSLIFVIYLFALLIGPVNIFVLNSKNKKVWVFWTVPAASAICCLVILSYYILGEDNVIKVKKECLALIDESQNKVYSFAHESYFSSSSKPEGLHYPQTAEITLETNSRYSVNNAKSINLDSDQKLTSGWIKAKIPRYLTIRNIETRRERVTFSKEGGEVYMTNGLGADISKITMKDIDGYVYEAAAVYAGTKTKMYRKGRNRTSNNLIDSVSDKWRYHSFRSLYSSTKNALKPNTYVAELNSTPFLPKQFKTSDRSEHTVVIGLIGSGEVTR